MKALIVASAALLLSFGFISDSQSSTSISERYDKVSALNDQLIKCKTKSCSKKVLTAKVGQEYILIFELAESFFRTVQNSDIDMNDKNVTAALEGVKSLLIEVEEEKTNRQDDLEALALSASYYDGISQSIALEEVHILEMYSIYLNTKLADLIIFMVPFAK